MDSVYLNYIMNAWFWLISHSIYFVYDWLLLEATDFLVMLLFSSNINQDFTAIYLSTFAYVNKWDNIINP